MARPMPQVPFGAVYFRKSNPPRADWERDYGVAAEDGLNTFRHWFMWSAIERRPGVYDWSDCDRQFDLAAENGIATIIAEFTMAAPDWLQRRLPHCRQIHADGTPMASGYSPSCAVGGFGQGLGGAGSLTLNAPEVHEAVMGFLTEMVSRYRGHPGLLGYDVNNEMNYQPDFDFSEQTAAAFRRWLQARYADLDTLAEAWHRYSYAEWDDIVPPRRLQPYAECLDWMAFRQDNFYGHVADKIATIRAADPDALVVSHGIAAAITAMAGHGCDGVRRSRSTHTATPGSRPARATSPGATSSRAISSVARLEASPFGTPNGRAGRSGCSHRSSAATGTTPAWPRPRTSASGRSPPSPRGRGA
jgi:beta-galactosidase